MENEIKTIFSSIFKTYNSVEKVNNDILLVNCPKDLLKQSYKLGLIRMKIGLLWEQVFTLFGYEKLKNGADLINHNTKVIIELKNLHNTDNSSSRKENIRKLMSSKLEGYSLVYGIINDKNSNSNDKIDHSNGIRYLSGYCLLSFVMGDQCENVITLLQNEFKEYFQQSDSVS